MPIYTVQGPDGRTYDVEGPANARPEDVLNYVRGTVGSELGKGLMRGGVGQTLVGAGGAAQAIGDAMTLDVPSVVANALGPVGIAYSSLAPLRKKFGELLSKEGDLVASAGDRVMKQFERAPALAQGNVWKDPSRLANPAWWSGGVGEGLGNLGTAYLGGRALGGASSLGKALGFAGVQAAQETAPEYRDMLASGMDKGEALARAGVMGLGSFALNYPGASAMGKESVGFLRRAAESFLKEVPTEYAEEIWQGIASGQITNLEQLKERAAAATEVLLPAAVGGVAGAGLTGRQKVAGGSPGDEAAFRDRLNGLGGLGGTAAPAMQDAGAGPIVDPNVLVPELLAQRTQQQAAQAAVERRGREGDTQLGETPNPQVPAPPVPPDPEQARLEALFARRSLGETLGAPEPSPPQAAPAAATQAPPLDFPMIDPTQGALAPEGPILQPYRPPAAPAPAVAPTGAAMAPQDAMAAAEQVRREQAALQSAITRANRQPGMAPEEVAALDAQALPERGMQPAAPEVAPLPTDSLIPAVGGRESLALAAQADQEQAAQREAERAAAWAKQPVQVRLSKDPGLKAGLERLRSEVGWYQEGGKAQIHPDTWFDLPFAEAEKMRAKAGSTSWIPRSEWWKERPVKINEKDSLEAIDRALKGEKLKPNQRKFIDYVERVYREGPAAVLRADGVREPEPKLESAPSPQSGSVAAGSSITDGDIVPAAGGSVGVSSDTARSYGPGRRAPRGRGAEPDRAYRLAVQRLGRDARLDDLEREAEKIRREGDGIDVSYAGKKAGEAGGQLAFDFETRPETNARQRAAAEAFISDLVARRDRRLGASVLADGLTRDFTGTGTASLIGRQIASFADYGVAAQVFRDPRVEHLRFHLVKDGVVVDEIYVSSRLPGAVHFTVPDAVARLQQAMKATGATGYYIQHNHPSGNPRPSGAEEYELTSGNQSLYDMGFTETVASSVPGFEAHVVVDNDAYSVIHQKPYLNARTAEEKMRVLKNRTGLLQVTRLPVPAGVQTYHTEKNPRVPHPNLGEMFSNSTQVVEYVKRNVAPDEETVTLIAIDSASKVKAIVNYPLRMLTGIDRGEMGAVARIRRLRAGAGAGFMVIAVARPKHEKALTRLMNLDLVQEAVINEPGQAVRKVWASSASRSLKDKIHKPIGGVRSASGVFDEPAPQYQGAEAERPSRVEAGGGSYSMAQFGNLTDQELATLTSVMDRLGQKIESERRGTRTWDATEEAALKLVQRKYGVTLDNLVERKKGSTANAEQLEAFGMMLADASKGATEAANAYARSNSAEDLARLLAAREKLGMMLAPAMGYRTEAGRALNILRKTAADFRRADELLGALGDGTENAMKDFARRLEQANGDPDKVIGLTRASYTPTLWDKFYEYWINGLLSGPLTHATNILSNAWWLTTELGAQAGATVISRDASARALAARVAGMVHGVSVGLANAGKAFLTEEPQLTPQTQLENQGPAIGGKLGKVIRIPSRALMGEDEFFKAIAYHGELASLAMDEALKDPNPKQRFNEIMGGILGRPDLIKKAREAAVRATFQDKLGPVMGNLNQALIKSKFGKVVVPFVRTPTNILKRAIEYTPAGYGMESVRQAIAAGGKDAALAYSRMSIGSGLMLGALGLAMQGLLTGAGPDDPRERQLWMRQGFQPYSVKIGNTWVRYSRIDPLATWLGIAGDMHEMAGAVGPNGLDADTLEKVGSMAVTSLALNLGDKSFLRGVSDFANAYADPKRYLADWASGLATSVIPNAIAQPTREADPYMREARNILDTARSKIPGLRQELAAKLDIAGEPIENPGGKFVIPFNTSPQREDRLAGAMLELGVFKGKPGRRLSLRGADVELTDAQYNAYVELLQKARYSTLTPLVSSPQFQQMKAQNPLAAGELLSRTWDRIGFQGRALFLQRNPDVLLALAGAKQRKVVEPSAYAAP